MQEEYLQSLVDSAPDDLKKYLTGVLRQGDEAVLLPDAAMSCESGEVKRVCVLLDGSLPNVPTDLFSKNWYTGVSVVAVSSKTALGLLSNAETRKEAVSRLKAAVNSEVHDSEFSAGAELECSGGSDTKEWSPGFDGPGCCVGLYSALHSIRPSGAAATEGMQRPTEQLFLVAKAGAGACGQTFHARLLSALRQGATLSDALSDHGSPGAEAKTRVSMASKRNRRRLLAIAAEALGLTDVNTVSDFMAVSGSPYMLAVPDYEVESNTLEQCESVGGAEGAWAYGAGCIDSTRSKGMIVCKNVADGFSILREREEGSAVAINRLYNFIPFGTRRVLRNRDAIAQAVQQHLRDPENPHPDQRWLDERFGWKSKQLGEKSQRIAPPTLWGSHGSECILGPHAKELGIAHLLTISLKPEAVCLAGVEVGKLRTAMKALA